MGRCRVTAYSLRIKRRLLFCLRLFSSVNMKQGELANIVGVRRKTIIRLENEFYNPSLKLTIDIEAVFHTTVEELLVSNKNPNKMHKKRLEKNT